MDSTNAETMVIEETLETSRATRPPHLTIRPIRGWAAVDFRELWQFRDLLFALAGRDIKLRYKQTALGVIWVVLQPLLTAGILSFVFGTVAHIQSDGVPYFIFAFAGQMAWGLFNSVLTKIGGSLVGNANLISKVFFPRLILPLSSIPSALVDFGISMGMLGVLMGIYRLAPGWGALLLPVWIVLLLMFAAGIGLVATSLMVSYRDVGYILPVAMQIVFYATPIVYPASRVPEKLRFWLNLNPLSSLFEATRWSIFGTGTLNWQALGYSAAAAVVVLLFGVYAFRRMEQKFADVI